MLRYIEGSVCPEKTDVKISSVLIFFCNNINEVNISEFFNIHIYKN